MRATTPRRSQGRPRGTGARWGAQYSDLPRLGAHKPGLDLVLATRSSQAFGVARRLTSNAAALRARLDLRGRHLRSSRHVAPVLRALPSQAPLAPSRLLVMRKRRSFHAILARAALILFMTKRRRSEWDRASLTCRRDAGARWSGCQGASILGQGRKFSEPLSALSPILGRWDCHRFRVALRSSIFPAARGAEQLGGNCARRHPERSREQTSDVAPAHRHEHSQPTWAHCAYNSTHTRWPGPPSDAVRPCSKYDRPNAQPASPRGTRLRAFWNLSICSPRRLARLHKRGECLRTQKSTRHGRRTSIETCPLNIATCKARASRRSNDKSFASVRR